MDVKKRRQFVFCVAVVPRDNEDRWPGRYAHAVDWDVVCLACACAGIVRKQKLVVMTLGREGNALTLGELSLYSVQHLLDLLFDSYFYFDSLTYRFEVVNLC